VPGRFEDRTVLRWAADGRGVLVRDQSMPVQISHVSLESGRVRPELRVPAITGRAGLLAVLTLFMSADGKTYAYSDSERLSRLYLVEGLAGSHRRTAER
jgi:hypothetical protein